MDVLITGTNRGIGAALRAELTSRGHAVTGTHRGEATADTLSLDVTDETAFAGLSAHLEGRALDCLVCNAGVFLEKGRSVEEMSADLWAQTMAANVTGVFLTIQACLPALRRSEAARIAIIGSKMGSDTTASGGNYIYRASKAAALNLGRNLAVDLEPEGIAVQVFHPGWIQTDMGGDSAELTLETAVPQLVTQIEKTDLTRTGAFLALDGAELPF